MRLFLIAPLTLLAAPAIANPAEIAQPTPPSPPPVTATP